MKIFTINFVALLLFVACEKKIPFKQEESDPRIVINSSFTKGDIIGIQLSESRNILFEGTLPIIENATAQLLDADDNVIGTFIYENSGYYYCQTVTLIPGTTYGVRVQKEGFNTATASSLLPKNISLTSIDTTAAPSGDLDITLSFIDDASQKNFYSVSIIYFGSFIDEGGGESIYVSSNFSTNEIYVVNGDADLDGKPFSNDFFFSDVSFNGQSADFTGTVERFEEYNLGGSYYIVKLKSLSEDLYKYNLSISKYQETIDNPFAEPVQVHSNIKDGYGIFGSSNKYQDTIWVD